MQKLPVWTGEEHVCEYLPDRLARSEYALAVSLTPQEYEQRMNDGWRKFGHILFRPVCTGCQECRPLRVPVATFVPNRSQRRTVERCSARFRVEFGPPRADAARISLYNRYQAAQEALLGWSPASKSAEEYSFSFVENPLPAIEISVWEQDALRAIVLTDVTPNIVSGVYHFYEPELRDTGIGVFAMLQTIVLGNRLGLEYAYFGFFVAGCRSLAYKARFKPCQILGTDGVWRAYEPTPF